MSGSSKRSIPTIAEAVDQHLAVQKTTYKDFSSLESVLRGAKGRVVGRKAAGPSLARCELGGLRCDRVEDHELAQWFEDRHEGLAHTTRRRGMAALRGFAKYCSSHSWFEPAYLDTLKALPKQEGTPDWLHPEQVVPLLDLIEGPEFDDYQRFAFYTLLSTGVRPAELIELRASSMNPREMTLTVIGKGAGDGKPRRIPIDPEYAARWQEHINRYDIAPRGWMLFHRAPRFVGGDSGTIRWVHDMRAHTSPQPIGRMLSHRESDNRASSLYSLARRRLPANLVSTFSITPVVLRRTFACLALIDHESDPNSGWDLITLQEAMGHTSLDITRTYLSDVHRYLGKHRKPFNAVSAAKRAAARRDEPQDPAAS